VRCDLIILPEADRDLDEQAEYLSRGRRGVGQRFYQAAQRTFDQLARMPGLGSPQEFQNPRLAGVRCARISGFEKHLIFYRPIQDGIEVLRVLHGARDVQGILEAEADALGDDEDGNEP
jgi:toxin ParE1/3/4